MQRTAPTSQSAGNTSRVAACLVAICGLVIWHGASATAVPQVDCQPLPTPSRTAQQVIAPRIIINGRLMNIVAASSALSPQDFAAYYKKLWQGQPGRPAYVENTIGPWDVVAHKQGQCFYTVQIRPDGKGGAGALLGISALDQDFGMGAVDFPAPADAEPLTHMVSRDGSRSGNTWLLYSNAMPTAVVAWYTQNLHAFGWNPDMPPGRSPAGTILMYSKGYDHAGIVVAPLKNGAAITLTVMSQ
ncbi:MAG: hypothetical protein JSR34_00285 [Proteobacteria bacterium]|nr:hypothetical protein [Pseudomonadota bacterium]